MISKLQLLFLALPILALSASSKPNFIVIYTDDHGWPDIGAAGIHEDLHTPNIDALAASGVRATNGYSSAPQCVPSRAGLLSGKAQNRFGVESNGMSMDGFDAELTIAERLKTAGYATGQIGKWHLGANPQITEHGFDDVYSKNANRPCYANYTLDGETIPMQQVDDGLFHLDACSKAATTFIQRHNDEPFFLYLAYRAPHVPLDAPEKYLSRFPGKMPERRRQALAMISAMDDGVGQIIADLKQRALFENTLIFFIGDNGAPLKIHKADAPGGGPGWDGSLNEPMNGEKGMLAEGGIRVPFIVSWPRAIPGGQTYDSPVTALDVASTAVELAGLPKDSSLDGMNLIPFLSGNVKNGSRTRSDLALDRPGCDSRRKVEVPSRWRAGYLFDLESDPGEKTNLLSKNPEIAKQLLSKLKDWSSELNPPGLTSKGMSSTWENYFDFYLDGKPAPSATKAAVGANNVQGWIARGGSLTIQNGSMAMKGDKKKQTPFIVTSGFEVKTPLKVKVRLKAKSEGSLGLAWRRKGDKDFLPDQKVSAEIAQSNEWLDVEATIKADAPVIHLRLILPRGGASIEKIEFENTNGKSVKTWNFKS